MAQVRDGLVPILEVVTLEKFFGVVGPHPRERFANGIGRAAIARQRIRAFFRRKRSDGDDAFQAVILAQALKWGTFEWSYDNGLRIHIARLHPDAILPRYAHGPAEDAGMDLHAIEDVVLPPSAPTLVPTGIAIELPPGYEAQIRPRSGLALKFAITVPNSPATIDPGYRGEIRVILLNLGREPYAIRKGDRIAQLIVAKYEAVEWDEADLADSERGSGGFGSSGR